MKLIKFYIDQYRVLRDIGINFERTDDDLMKSHQGYALDFLAGVNGTGKTTVLQILAKLFNTLQTEIYNFPIPVELIYSIQKPTGEDEIITVSNIEPDDQEYSNNKLVHTIDELDPSSAKMRPKSLPTQVVVYTTGSETAWCQELGLAEDFIPEAQIGVYVDNAEEATNRYLQELPGHQPSEVPEDVESNFNSDNIVLFIYEERFPLVTLCGLLASLKDKLDQDKDEQVLQPVLEAIEINGMRNFSLRIRKHQDLTLPFQLEIIQRLEEVADQVNQIGADRLLLFNVDQQLEKYQDNKSNSIFGIYGTSITLFKHLNLLYEHRPYYDAPLQEVNVFLRKRGPKSESEKNGGDEPSTMLHLLDWLSDGERSFLGRMALFALFRAENLLIILDEPEVHFNDVWKREVVHMLDQIMAGCASHAIISTHSSIALTDVQQNDILVFRRFGQYVEGDDAVRSPNIRTLGADPSDIMVHVFGTQFASGEHSVRYIREQIGKSASRQELEELQKSIAPGYWHYRVQLEMEQFGSEVQQ